MHSPFYDSLVAVINRGPRFFVPGHKGNPAALPALAALARLDMTSVEGCEDLSHKGPGPLQDSQDNMARVFGAGATLYSADGSTSCVQAMLALFLREGGAVAVGRGGHVSGLRGLGLLGARPVWVPRRGGYVLPGDLDAALAQSGAKAAHITSPDYYGRLADVAALAEVCRKHGAALLVDNAQGAHLRFFSKAAWERGEHLPAEGAAGSLHPLAQGADAVNDSAHKTLPCLTPAALLHVRDAALAGAARAALDLFCSTSPSYPVLASMDLAAGLLAEAPPDFAAAARRLKKAGEALGQAVAPCDDPLRLVLCPASAGIEGAAFYAAMLKAGIAPEFWDGEAYVLMAGPYNSEADFAALEAALAEAGRLPRRAAKRAWAGFAARGEAAALPPEVLPEAVTGLREAMLGPREEVPIERAAGRVCAAAVAPCPPGTPLAAPGERLSPELCRRMAAGGILAIDVVK